MVVAFLAGRAIYSPRAESPVTWTTGAFEATPAGSDLVSAGDDRIRELKSTIRDYAEGEICWGDASATGCGAANDSRMREGSARAFFDDTEPTTLNGTDRNGSTTLDNGRLWVDSNDTNDNRLRVHSGSAWEEVNGVPSADRTNWDAADTQLDEHLLAVKATLDTPDDIAGVNCAGASAVNWNTEAFDDSTMHDNVTNNTRLTTPTGATRVRIHGYLHFDSTGATTYVMPIAVRQDGSTVVATHVYHNGNATVEPRFTFSTGPLVVTGGTTYFEIIPNSTSCSVSDTNGDEVQTDSYVTMEVIK